MGARWYNPATGSFGNKDTVSNKPVPDSASASPFGYAADNPLGLTDPTGHRPVDGNGVTDQGWLTSQVTAAKAAAKHKAVIAKAATKIATRCAGNLTDGPDTHACNAAVYRAAGGQYTNGVPNWKGYDPAVADQAMGVVRQQYQAATTGSTPNNGQPTAGTSVEISPHLYVAANDPNLAKLRASYQWASNYLHSVGGATDEYDIWQRACTISPEHSACNGVVDGYLHANIPFEDIAPSGWAMGFGAVLSANGVAAAVVLPGTPASQAALQALLAVLVKHVYNNKTVAQVIKAYEKRGLSTKGAWRISGEEGPEYDQMVNFLKAESAAGNLQLNEVIASAAHPETWLSTLMAQGKITSRNIVITNPKGVCDACKLAIPRIFSQGDGVTISSPSGPGGSFISEYIAGAATPPAGPADDAPAE